jgi:hypothetical protein
MAQITRMTTSLHPEPNGGARNAQSTWERQIYVRLQQANREASRQQS